MLPDAFDASRPPDEVRQGRQTPTGRSGTPADVAGALALLCGPGVGPVTGQCLGTDGGNAVSAERA